MKRQEDNQPKMVETLRLTNESEGKLTLKMFLTAVKLLKSCRANLIVLKQVFLTFLQHSAYSK